jgi:hypothetical protein
MSWRPYVPTNELEFLLAREVELLPDLIARRHDIETALGDARLEEIAARARISSLKTELARRR